MKTNNEYSPLLDAPNDSSSINFDSSGELKKREKVYWEAFFVVLPVFSGYAGLFALQAQLKTKIYHISNNTSKDDYLFGVAVSFLYIGNLIFRLMHNVIFGWLSSRNRVIVSILSLFSSMFLLVLLSFVKNMAKTSLAWVFIAYGLGGMGIGTFEANVLATLTPLGPTTKMWAIIAIPVGIVLITIGSFVLLQFGVYVGYIYMGIGVGLGCGMLVYFVRIYSASVKSGNQVNVNSLTISDFFRHMRDYKNWARFVAWHSFSNLFDMFCVSLFSPGVILYIYDKPTVNFRWTNTSIPTNWFFVLYDACFFVGDFSSRRIWYPVRPIFPFLFLIFSACGIVMGLSNVAEFVPFCAFLIAFANGSIYAQTVKVIDSKVPREYNLISLSFWLFIGDVGSVIGSNVTQPLINLISRLYH
eukprot:TRINITY_DN7681_c0_g1_i1.p1 TRINITY_DN7681_c0_g1~~TRINITY_DN7681_c0_g1_i1.p1  ORF type:complete len:414 (+),score=79.81 TRINITY_DN7681_c0_g1_i1:37-1278(+)